MYQQQACLSCQPMGLKSQGMPVDLQDGAIVVQVHTGLGAPVKDIGGQDALD